LLLLSLRTISVPEHMTDAGAGRRLAVSLQLDEEQLAAHLAAAMRTTSDPRELAALVSCITSHFCIFSDCPLFALPCVRVGVQQCNMMSR
jgi:hypothetical protein